MVDAAKASPIHIDAKPKIAALLGCFLSDNPSAKAIEPHIGIAIIHRSSAPT
jgi:hypothetical protein